MGRDFREARRKAREAADEAVGDKLDAILDVAAQLEGIFGELELSDQETHASLIKIVRDATEKNESLATVIDRVRDLGDVGQELAERIAEVTSAGALAAVRGALNV